MEGLTGALLNTNGQAETLLFVTGNQGKFEFLCVVLEVLCARTLAPASPASPATPPPCCSVLVRLAESPTGKSARGCTCPFTHVYEQPLIRAGRVCIEMVDVEIAEIQADSIAEICRAKAEEAFKLLGRCVSNCV